MFKRWKVVAVYKGVYFVDVDRYMFKLFAKLRARDGNKFFSKSGHPELRYKIERI